MLQQLIVRLQLWRDERGQGLVEYALILSLVSIAAIGVLTVLGVDVANVLDQVENKLNGSQATPPAYPT